MVSQQQPSAEAVASPSGSQWLDVRVIYVRVAAPAVSYAEAPEKLVMRCIPRDIRSEMEMNGARIPPSEPACLTLRLDRTDEETSEAMYVSTDKLRLSSSLPFAIFHGEEQLAEGLVSCRESLPPWGHIPGSSGPGVPMASLDWNSDIPPQRDDSPGAGPRPLEWGMKCSCTVSPSWPGFTIKSIQDLTTGQPVQPSLEVCVVGKCAGASVMLTDQVQLLARKRSQWKGGLDAIPESEGAGSGNVVTWRPGPGEEHLHHHPYQEFQGDEKPGNELALMDGHEHPHNQQGSFMDGMWPSQSRLQDLYGEVDENGEMTWFNAGVRVGVGIGLGMCIGVGIGVGLIVKTYQATTRPFRRGRLM